MPTTSDLVVREFFDIPPVNTIETIETGGYHTYHPQNIGQIVALETAQGAKNLYLVCFGRPIREAESTGLLQELSMQHCRQAPNYLLGLMAQVREGDMPEELRCKSLVAAEPDNVRAIFKDPSGSSSFLCVYRDGQGRALCLATILGPQSRWPKDWAFLAENC
ncbi:MAG: hypothetical protein PHS62_01980 [Patescibacteria group bacterium]|nr:hypothetical protein [Patescibacteria group bacterium]